MFFLYLQTSTIKQTYCFIESFTPRSPKNSEETRFVFGCGHSDFRKICVLANTIHNVCRWQSLHIFAPRGIATFNDCWLLLISGSWGCRGVYTEFDSGKHRWRWVRKVLPQLQGVFATSWYVFWGVFFRQLSEVSAGFPAKVVIKKTAFPKENFELRWFGGYTFRES